MFKRRRYAKTDFKLSMLPATRGQQFRAVLKNEKLTFLYLGLILLAFALPILAVDALRGEYASALYSLIGAGEGQLAQAQADYTFLMEDFFFDFLMLLAFLIYGIGLSGCLQIFRNLAYDEGVLFGSDFKEGIKKNIGPVLILMAIFAILRAILHTLENTSQLLKNSYFYIGIWLVFGFNLLLVVPLLLVWFGETAAYSNRIKNNLRNLFPLLGYGYFGSVLFSLGVMGCYFIPLLGHSVWLYLAFVLLSLVSPYYFYGWHLYSLSVFDKTLNQDYPEYLYRGLHR